MIGNRLNLKKPYLLVFGMVVIILIQTGYVKSQPATDIRIIKEDGKVINPEHGIWQNREFPLDFDLVDTIDLTDIGDLLLSDIKFLSLDDEDNIYFFDQQLNQLISVDQEGNLRWAVGQKGRGPGDFENPVGMGIDNEKIYISNMGGFRLDEFDLDGNFIRSYNIPKEVQFRYGGITGIRDNGEIIMSSTKYGLIGIGVSIMKPVSGNLKSIRNFKIIETEKDKFQRVMARGYISLHDDQLAYSFNTSNSHRFYQFDSTLTMEVTRAFDGVLGPGIHRGSKGVRILELGAMSAPVFLDNGYYFINIRYPVNVSDPNEYVKRVSNGNAEDLIFEEVIDLYNPEHELMYVYKNTEDIESLGALNVRDSKGYYYSVFNDDLIIRKYRIAMKG